MHKVLCLDVGTKRIGVAVSDFLHITVTGLCCVNRVPEHEVLSELKGIIADNKIGKIIIGLPKNMDGSEGVQANDCRNFAKVLQEGIKNIPIEFEDERLTSDLAEENLRERKIDFRKNKGLVDIESACIILEQYLARQNS